jgi:hypothetical protein
MDMIKKKAPKSSKAVPAKPKAAPKAMKKASKPAQNPLQSVADEFNKFQKGRTSFWNDYKTGKGK